MNQQQIEQRNEKMRSEKWAKMVGVSRDVVEDMNDFLEDNAILWAEKQRLNPSLDLYKSPCHSNYGNCCGVFIDVIKGDLVCNECGMGIIELLETQAGRKVS